MDYHLLSVLFKDVQIAGTTNVKVTSEVDLEEKGWLPSGKDRNGEL